MINSCAEESLPFQFKSMEAIQSLMGCVKIFNQVSNLKITNTIFVLILSYTYDFSLTRSLLMCISKSSRELCYNSNMLNVIYQKNEKLVFEKAIMDLGSTWSTSSFWTNEWANPRLDSPTGFHNNPNLRDQDHHWEVTFPKNHIYEVSKLYLMKRGDNVAQERLI